MALKQPGRVTLGAGKPASVMAAKPVMVGGVEVRAINERQFKEKLGPSAEEELRRLNDKFHQSAKKEQANHAMLSDPTFWVAVVFQSGDQKRKFMSEMGWGNEDDQYIDGQELAFAAGITLPPGPKFPKQRGFAELARMADEGSVGPIPLAQKK